MKRHHILMAFLLAFLNHTVIAQQYEPNVSVETFVGSGFNGDVDGNGVNTMLGNFTKILKHGEDFYIFDTASYKAKKIDKDRNLSTVGKMPNLSVYAIDQEGICYGSNAWGIDIFAIGSDQTVRFAGSETIGYKDGPKLSAQFNHITHLCFDSLGNIFILEIGNKRVRKISKDGIVSTFAGSGNSGVVDGKGIFSSFEYPTYITTDSNDDLYILDSRRIRKVSKDQTVKTLYTVGSVTALSVDNLGRILYTDYFGIKRIGTDGIDRWLAGSGSEEFRDGIGKEARFGVPSDLCWFSGDSLLVADPRLYRVRLVKLSSEPQPIPAELDLYPGITLSGTIGSRLRVEYTETPESPSSWVFAELVTLQKSPQIWFDLDGNKQKKRFYRASLLP